jgi:2-polyprenyl-6-methoxyphenol hydroxylase-like FAD-dependent oxidoreductase
MKAIKIIGGGLAGLTLGIGLRRREVPVIVCEAGHYPRHRVCGEFINGRGQDVLARLGLRESIEQAGAATATTCAFFSAHQSSPVRPLPAPALCLSRFTLDALLAARFLQLGGELRENERFGQIGTEEGLVRASGRRLQSAEDGWRWVGLKVHARAVRLAADLEVHAVPDGYVGVCRLAHDEVNICGLFRRRALVGGVRPSSGAALCEKGRASNQAGFSETSQLAGTGDGRTPLRVSAQTWQEILRGRPGTLLRERLSNAVLDERSFCSVAGLTLRPQRAADHGECCIGDALTMIPPVTGNGMSLAIESAELAIEPLAAYSRGETIWAEVRQGIARACDVAFARRLAWARWLQRLMLAPLLQGRLGVPALRSDWLWRAMYNRTR